MTGWSNRSGQVVELPLFPHLYLTSAEEDLIEKAKALFAADSGVSNPNLLADDFR